MKHILVSRPFVYLGYELLVIFDMHVDCGLFSFVISSLKIILQVGWRSVAGKREEDMIYLLSPQCLCPNFFADHAAKIAVLALSLKQSICDKEKRDWRTPAIIPIQGFTGSGNSLLRQNFSALGFTLQKPERERSQRQR